MEHKESKLVIISEITPNCRIKNQQRRLPNQENETSFLKLSLERREDHNVTWWNEKCDREEKIVRAEYRYYRLKPRNKNKLRSFQCRKTIKQSLKTPRGNMAIKWKLKTQNSTPTGKRRKNDYPAKQDCRNFYR